MTPHAQIVVKITEAEREHEREREQRARARARARAREADVGRRGVRQAGAASPRADSNDRRSARAQSGNGGADCPAGKGLPRSARAPCASVPLDSRDGVYLSNRLRLFFVFSARDEKEGIP